MEQFTRDGLRFDVIDSGPEDGPVVVLLHGFPQFADSWAEISGRLTAQGYRCLAPNQRGYSPGARPRGRRAYRISEGVADVHALIEQSGARKVHLVGHDWGGAIGWNVAARLPDRLASYTALSTPHPAAFLRALLTSRQALASWYMYCFQLPMVPERVLTGPSGRDWSRLRSFLIKSRQDPDRAERDARAMAESGALGPALNWYRAVLLANPRANDVRVSVPSLYIWSDQDTALLRKAADHTGDWVSGPYRFETLHGVSHWIPEEAPDRTAALLLEHFAAHPA